MGSETLILSEIKSLKEMNVLQFKHLDERHESLNDKIDIAMAEIIRNKGSIETIFKHNVKQDESIAGVILTHEKEHGEIEKKVEAVKNRKDLALATNLKGLAWKIIVGIVTTAGIGVGSVKLIQLLSGG